MDNKSRLSHWEKIAGFIFGCIFLMVLLLIAVLIPNPTPSQYITFQTILALSAAGVAGILAGFIEVESKLKTISIKAGGALAVFIVTYLLTPAAQEPVVSSPAVQQIIESGGKGALHTGEGNIVIEGNE